MKLNKKDRQKLKDLITYTYHIGYRDDIDELYNIYEKLNKYKELDKTYYHILQKEWTLVCSFFMYNSRYIPNIFYYFIIKVN